MDQLLEHIEINTHGAVRRIELVLGDLSAIPRESAVDALVVSAFPDSYAPTPGTLIAALQRNDVRLRDLADDKFIDLRSTASCWVSKPVDGEHGFRNIICFEPLYRSTDSAALVVGDLFRSLVPLNTSEPWIRSIAMPILAAGRQKESPDTMLAAIVEASVHWLTNGLDLSVIRVVVYNRTPRAAVDKLRDVFTRVSAEAKQKSAAESRSHATSTSTHEYDFFLSYSHQDKAAANRLLDAINEIDPEIRVFIDRIDLDSGSAWQQSIYDAIDASKHVVCLYSPTYLQSKVCIEELHIGLIRNRDEGGVLLPAYLRTAPLPTYLKLIQYSDIRESDQTRITHFARSLVNRIRQSAPESVAPGPSASQPEPAAHVAVSTDDGTQVVDVDLQKLLQNLVGGGEVRLDVRIRLRND